jgi:hypothetical protein
VEGEFLEDGPEFVVGVGPAAEDFEDEVDLARGLAY